MNHLIRLLFGLAATLMLLTAGTAWPASADGIVFPSKELYIEMPEQQAIIVYDEEKKHEDLILSVGLLGSPRADQKTPPPASQTPMPREDAVSAAWVVPVPSRPEVKAASPRWFDHLSDLTRPMIETKVVYVQEMEVEKGAEKDVAPLELLSREQVGVYDVSVLSAHEPGVLLKWLNDHGYVFPDKGEPILDAYVNEGGWYFVAARVLPGESATVEGGVQPLWVSFDTDQPIYPMRLTSLVGQHRIYVLLYVLAEHRMQIGGLHFDTEFAGRLELSPWPGEDPDLKHLLTHRPYYVTKLRQAVYPAYNPKDLYLERATSDEPYREVIYNTVYRYTESKESQRSTVPERATVRVYVVDAQGQFIEQGQYRARVGLYAGLILLGLLIGLGIAWYWRSRWKAGRGGTAS